MHVYCWLSNLSIKQHPRIGNCILEFDEFLHHYKQRWLDLRGRQGGPVSEAANIPSSSTCPSRTGVPCMTLLICIPKKTLWIFVYIDCFHRCCSVFHNVCCLYIAQRCKNISRIYQFQSIHDLVLYYEQ